MFKARIAIPVALGVLYGNDALGNVISLAPFDDNSIFSNSTNSNGAGPYLFAGKTIRNGDRRALLKFDVAGSIPQGSTINTTTLSLHVSNGLASRTISLHRLLADWGEGTSNSGTFGGGNGALPTTNDATWQHRFYPSAFWSTPGGDFAVTASASATISPPNANFRFDSTTSIVANVQQWLNSPATNFGWLLKGTEVNPGDAVRFDSKENATASFRPSLSIDFTPPPPQWNLNANGSWSVASNWLPAAVPNSPTATANFLGKITAPRTVTLDGSKTVGALRFDNPNAYTIAPGSGGTLTVQSTSGAAINVAGGSHVISAPFRIAESTALAISSGSSLTIASNFSMAAGESIDLSSPGILTISGAQPHDTLVGINANNGRLNLNSNAGAPASVASAATARLALNIAGAARVVLGAHQDLRELTVDTDPAGPQTLDLNSGGAPGAFHSVRVYSANLTLAKISLYDALKNAHGPGASDHTDGITDTGISSHPNSRIGLTQLADAHGQQMVLIRPTRIGDLNLDGFVTISDFIDLASHFNGTGTWQEGDLNYDGNVTISDFIDLAANFNTTYSGQTFPIGEADHHLLSAFAGSLGVSPVPEPATLSLLLLSFACLYPRRRAFGR